MNWIAANTVPKIPTQRAALEMSPPTMRSIRCGRTGMITPKDRMSIATVMKMKASAALRTRGTMAAAGSSDKGRGAKEARGGER